MPRRGDRWRAPSELVLLVPSGIRVFVLEERRSV